MIFDYGIVEDIDDPLKNDRVRVRVFSIHDSSKVKVPTDKLPWMQVGMSGDASISGVGSNHTLVNGSLVLVYVYNDGQNGTVICSLKAIPKELADASKGFNDPDGVYPKYTDESDVNRLARNDKIDETIVQTKKDDVVNVDIAFSGTWSEPQTAYATIYPYNKVYYSRSGHVQEFDDTEGAERIHTYHKSGSFEEYHPDGSRVQKIVKDNFTIVVGDNNVYIKGDVNVTCEGNVNILVNGNANTYIKGSAKQEIDGSLEQTVNGSANIKVDGSTTIDTPTTTVTGDLNVLGNTSTAGNNTTGGNNTVGGGLTVAGTSTLTSVTSNGINIGGDHKHSHGDPITGTPI